MPFVTPLKRIALVVATVMGLVACAAPPAPEVPELTFTHLPPITLGVAAVEVVDNTRRADGAVHVEDRMPVPPKAALRNWARDRLRASGVSGVAKFIIEDAQVTETELARKGGLTGALTKEQSHRYNAHVRVQVRLEGVPRVSEAFASADVKRSRTIPEDASINDREQLWFELTEQTMQDFDPLMAASIRKHLADFVR